MVAAGSPLRTDQAARLRSNSQDRQRRTLDELILQNQDQEQIHRVVRQLANRRLLVTTQRGEDESAEIIHDALLQQWQRLQLWRSDDREFQLWQQRLEVDILAWEGQDRPIGLLLREIPLSIAEAYLNSRREELHLVETDYVRASIEQQRTELDTKKLQTRRRILISIAGVVIFTFLVRLAFTLLGVSLTPSSSIKPAATQKTRYVLASNASCAETHPR